MPALQNRLHRASQNLPGGSGRPAMSYDEWLHINGFEGKGQQGPGPQAIHAYNALVPRMAGQQFRPNGGMSSGPTARDVAMQRAAENRQRQAALQDGRLQQQREMEQLQLTTGTQYDIASGNAAADLYRQEMVGNQQFNQLREQGAINQVLSREEQAARMRLQELAGRQDLAAVRERGQIEQAIQEMRGRQAMAERESMNQNALQLDDRATQRAFTLDDRGSQRAYNLQDMGSAASLQQIGAEGQIRRDLQGMSDQGALNRLATSGQQEMDQLDRRFQQEMDQLDRRGQQANRLQRLQGRQGIKQQTLEGRQQMEQQGAVGESYLASQQLRGQQETEARHQEEVWRREQQGQMLSPEQTQELQRIESKISATVRAYGDSRINETEFEKRMAVLTPRRRAAEIPTVRPRKQRIDDQLTERKDGQLVQQDGLTGEIRNIYFPPSSKSVGPDQIEIAQQKAQQQRQTEMRSFVLGRVQAEQARDGQVDADGVAYRVTSDSLQKAMDSAISDWNHLEQVTNPAPPPPQPYGNEMMNHLIPQQGGQAGPQSGYNQLQPSNLYEMLPSQLMRGFQPPPDQRTSFEAEQDQQFEGVLGQLEGSMGVDEQTDKEILATQELLTKYRHKDPRAGSQDAVQLGRLTNSLKEKGILGTAPEQSVKWSPWEIQSLDGQHLGGFESAADAQRAANVRNWPSNKIRIMPMTDNRSMPERAMDNVANWWNK